MADRPSGTVTFLFTDIEGSTELWEEYAAEMQVALEAHDAILRSAIDGRGGYVFSTAGDAFAAAFARAGDALAGAQSAQEALRSASWPTPAPIRVRMGLHTGEAQERDGDYFGSAVNRAARIMSAGHGDQVLVSSATVAVLGVEGLRELGEYRLKDLSASEHLYQLGDRRFPPLRTLDVVQHNLPVERTPLVGRKSDVEEITSLVEEHRLVTLLGIGGTGKTRLATAVAAEMADRFSDGVWFVDLVPVAGSEQVVEAIATAAGLSVSGPDLVAALADLISSREMLVVFDNCEHVTDDVADIVDALLEETVTPAFLATSREPLQLIDERHVHVGPLVVGDDITSPAVELFTMAAERVGAEISSDQVTVASGICEQLDGLPLSIELAAAQLRHFTVAELADRLDQRFEILTRRGRGRRRRQASLQAVLEDAWSMLDNKEQELLVQLAAFPASFAADDVDEVGSSLTAGITAATLAGLVDLGLVARDGDGRHRLLETVKLFAQDQWSNAREPEQYERRHSDWILGRVCGQPVADRYTSIRFVGWAHLHYEDHRAVEDRLAAGGAVEQLVDQLHALIWVYQVETGSRSSALADRLETYLDRFDLTDHQRGRLRLVQAAAALPSRRPDLMVTASNEATELLRRRGSSHELAWALIHNSWMKVFNRPAQAVADLDEAIKLTDSEELSPLADVALAYRANHLLLSGRPEEAEIDLQDLNQRVSNRDLDYGRCMLLTVLPASRVISDPQLALTCRTELGDHYQQLLGRRWLAWSDLVVDAIATASVGHTEQTLAIVIKAQELVRKSDNDNGLPDLLLPLAMLAFSLGDNDRARRYLTAIRSAPRPTGWFPITVAYRQLRDRIGLLDTNPLTDSTIEDVYEQATDWMVSL